MACEEGAGEKRGAEMSISTEDFWALSPQDRQFYLDNKDEMEMVVLNGKLHFKVQQGPDVTWPRFQELLQLKERLTEQENKILHVYTDFNDWNRFSRPYREHGFYYFLDIDVSSYGLEQEGIKQDAKEWLCNWLLEHGFTQDDVTRVKYTGGTGGYDKERGRYFYKSYGIEVRCQFRHIPSHYLPQKVINWVKRNKQYDYLVFGRKEVK